MIRQKRTTKIGRNLPILFKLTKQRQFFVFRFRHNFLAFLEYMNFKRLFSYFLGILEDKPTKEDNAATTKAKYFYQSCMNICKLIDFLSHPLYWQIIFLSFLLVKRKAVKTYD